MIRAIICIGSNRVMGHRGTMPWGDKPLDGSHFRSMTLGSTVVMGRRTYESIGSKPLPKRKNVVLSSNPMNVRGEVLRATDINAILRLAEHEDVWIIGGARVYQAFTPHIQEWYVTVVGEEFEGDRFMPDMHQLGEWNHEHLRVETPTEKCPYYLSFSKFTRKA